MVRLFAIAAVVAGLLGVASGPATAVAGDGVLDVYVTDSRGVPLAHASIEIDGRGAETDMWGRARVDGVQPGIVTIDHPRFSSRTIEWTDAGDRVHATLGGPVLRAIHVAGTLVGTTQWDNLVALADRTAVNAFMLDIKDESGRVFPETASAWAIAAGANLDRWNLAAVTADLHERDLSVIARIVSFQDPIAGQRLPDLAVRTSTGEVFSRRGQTFLDATDPDAREYALQLAEEACAAGVDEVQFDYVRYPDGDHASLRFDGGNTAEVRVATITGFLADAKARVGSACRVAADIFGFVTSVPNDGGIGQQIEAVAGIVDVVSPMAYPNHWGPGWFGFASPADHPGEVIDGSMRDAIERTAGLSSLRPWLQDFGGYGPDEVRAQVDAADRLGLGWMLWNAGSVFTEDGIPLEDEVITPGDVPPVIEEAIPPSGFWDVPAASAYSDAIEWLGAAGITRGCNPPWRDDFCPSRELTRAQAATMLVRALDLGAADEAGHDRFTDDDTSVHEADIDALAAAGITYGCAADRFCPDATITRQQMASLLARALDLPAAAVTTATFADDDGSIHEPDIERLAAAGITHGCAPDNFCPVRPVRRDEVAAFLYRALG